MTERSTSILRHSADVWMSDPIRLGFQQVGYISAGEANQQADYERMVAHQNEAAIAPTSMSARRPSAS